MPKKFDQAAKDRVICLVEGRILVGNIFYAGSLRDVVLVERINAVNKQDHSVYGMRKMWHALQRDGISIDHE